MEIYTSYFGHLKKLGAAGIKPIGIARWKPHFYNGVNMFSVAPTRYMLSDDCDEEEYLVLYDEMLKRLGAKRILQEIESLSGGRNVALLCYEKPGDFCHRHLLADFLNKELGLNIREFDGSTPQPKQISLFD
ncbi:MAG: DUF488 domain-containing protein [Prevotella sp.]|nr:DUF488 domain-containing protein [Prevotella sp.]